MKLGFAMPHMVRLKAMLQPWELAVTGADQTRLGRWAEKLGYAMIAVPEHFVIPRSHVELSGPFYFNAYTAMAHFAGATETHPRQQLHRHPAAAEPLRDGQGAGDDGLAVERPRHRHLRGRLA